jgi:putative hemolysin
MDTLEKQADMIRIPGGTFRLDSDRMQRATIFFVSLWLALGCAGTSAQVLPAPQLANPASQNCATRGGVLKIERRPDGGQFGVCVFTDNYQCEEWAMFRGECPVGGLRVTGYITAAARYCAITGGRYTVVAKSGTPDEQGACALPGGKACAAGAYYAGSCGR